MPLISRLLRWKASRELGQCRPGVPAILAHYYHSIPCQEHNNLGTAPSMPRPRITPALLPHAIALAEASRLPRPLLRQSVFSLLYKLYSRPNRLVASVPRLPIGLVRQITSTYDAMDAMANGFAACALERISPPGKTWKPTSQPLSPAEHFRFCRALYRFELFYTLHRKGASFDDMNDWFFTKHSPWENEQLACVYSYLGIRLDQGASACTKTVGMSLLHAS